MTGTLSATDSIEEATGEPTPIIATAEGVEPSDSCSPGGASQAQLLAASDPPGQQHAKNFPCEVKGPALAKA